MESKAFHMIKNFQHQEEHLLIFENCIRNTPDRHELNNSTGTIEGIPQVKGTFNFLLGVSDSNQLSDEADLQLAIRENTLPVAVNDTVSTVEIFSLQLI
jgi:hypothetical protein